MFVFLVLTQFTTLTHVFCPLSLISCLLITCCFIHFFFTTFLDYILKLFKLHFHLPPASVWDTKSSLNLKFQSHSHTQKKVLLQVMFSQYQKWISPNLNLMKKINSALVAKSHLNMYVMGTNIIWQYHKFNRLYVLLSYYFLLFDP